MRFGLSRGHSAGSPELATTASGFRTDWDHHVGNRAQRAHPPQPTPIDPCITRIAVGVLAKRAAGRRAPSKCKAPLHGRNPLSSSFPGASHHGRRAKPQRRLLVHYVAVLRQYCGNRQSRAGGVGWAAVHDAITDLLRIGYRFSLAGPEKSQNSFRVLNDAKIAKLSANSENGAKVVGTGGGFVGLPGKPRFWH
jgi:hypothetical protein